MEHTVVSSVFAVVTASLFVATVVLVLIAARERPWRRFSSACVGLFAFESALLGMAFGRAVPWVQTVDSLGVLLCLLALAFELATPQPLTHWAECDAEGGDPAWWPSFERSFRQYATAPCRDPLRAASARRSENRS